MAKTKNTESNFIREESSTINGEDYKHELYRYNNSSPDNGQRTFKSFNRQTIPLMQYAVITKTKTPFQLEKTDNLVRNRKARRMKSKGANTPAIAFRSSDTSLGRCTCMKNYQKQKLRSSNIVSGKKYNKMPFIHRTVCTQGFKQGQELNTDADKVSICSRVCTYPAECLEDKQKPKHIKEIEEIKSRLPNKTDTEDIEAKDIEAEDIESKPKLTTELKTFIDKCLCKRDKKSKGKQKSNIPSSCKCDDEKQKTKSKKKRENIPSSCKCDEEKRKGKGKKKKENIPSSCKCEEEKRKTKGKKKKENKRSACTCEEHDKIEHDKEPRDKKPASKKKKFKNLNIDEIVCTRCKSALLANRKRPKGTDKAHARPAEVPEPVERKLNVTAEPTRQKVLQPTADKKVAASGSNPSYLRKVINASRRSLTKKQQNVAAPREQTPSVMNVVVNPKDGTVRNTDEIFDRISQRSNKPEPPLTEKESRKSKFFAPKTKKTPSPIMNVVVDHQKGTIQNSDEVLNKMYRSEKGDTHEGQFKQKEEKIIYPREKRKSSGSRERKKSDKGDKKTKKLSKQSKEQGTQVTPEETGPPKLQTAPVPQMLVYTYGKKISNTDELLQNIDHFDRKRYEKKKQVAAIDPNKKSAKRKKIGLSESSELLPQQKILTEPQCPCVSTIRKGVRGKCTCESKFGKDPTHLNVDETGAIKWCPCQSNLKRAARAPEKSVIEKFLDRHPCKDDIEKRAIALRDELSPDPNKHNDLRIAIAPGSHRVYSCPGQETVKRNLHQTPRPKLDTSVPKTHRSPTRNRYGVLDENREHGNFRYICPCKSGLVNEHNVYLGSKGPGIEDEDRWCPCNYATSNVVKPAKQKEQVIVQEPSPLPTKDPITPCEKIKTIIMNQIKSKTILMNIMKRNKETPESSPSPKAAPRPKTMSLVMNEYDGTVMNADQILRNLNDNVGKKDGDEVCDSELAYKYGGTVLNADHILDIVNSPKWNSGRTRPEVIVELLHKKDIDCGGGAQPKRRGRKSKKRSSKKRRGASKSNRNRREPSGREEEEPSYTEDMDDAPQRSDQPCSCGTPICSREIKRLKMERESKISNPKDLLKPCICGSKTCKESRYKDPVYRKKLQQRNKVMKSIKKRKREGQKHLLADRAARFKYYEKEDKARYRKILKEDKEKMKIVERYKNADAGILLAESVVDIGRLGLSAAGSIIRTAYRYGRYPKDIQPRLLEPPRTMLSPVRSFLKCLIQSRLPGTYSRVKRRIQCLRVVQHFKALLETHPATHFLVHMTDKDPKKRHAKVKPIKIPADFGCSIYMSTLRTRPYIWIYYMCPWFYPHCLSIRNMWRQLTDIILFTLAVGVWSPCVLFMELLRAIVCCLFCTGGG
ncbi:uncharacterized protein LOC142973808 [Anticarsia gemmatalis]|uniref:uncharacterized protein LOC142973808 n=1 Tax=Anticarsia gemmatalis TaxID=129554 RepID=UPI003F75D4D9